MSVKYYVSFLILMLSLASFAQIDGRYASIDMGVIDRGHERIFEMDYVNSSDKRMTLLRVEGPIIYDVRTDIREIMPSEKMRIRIKLSPKKKGKAKDEIKFFFSGETYIVKVSSDVEYVDLTDKNPCPDFESVDKGDSGEWEVYFKVVERYTREIIPHAEITLTGKKGQVISLQADKNGEVTAQVPIDFYLISAKKDGFASFDRENYINKRNADHVLTMMSSDMGTSVTILHPSDRGEEEGEDKDPEPIKENELVEIIEEKAVPVPEANGDFSLEEFKPNNVVFLIDISTSMRQEDRIELLKTAMIELAGMLRPDDIISIVTYATQTDIVVSGLHAVDTERVKEVIEALTAEGMTAGEAGLKQAYRECERHLIKNGNNHVYLATDGAFNAEYDKMLKKVLQMNEKDMHLTILAIRSNKWSDKRMIALAESGGGRHLKIEDSQDQDALKTLIRQQSKR